MDTHEAARFRFRLQAPGIIGMTLVVVPAIAYLLWTDGARFSTVLGYPSLVGVLTLSTLYRLRRWEQQTASITVSEVAQRAYEWLWLVPLGALLLALLVRG